MNYSFIKIASYNFKFLKHYYEQNPEIIVKDYNAQYKHLMSKGIAWANYFEIYLSELGVEATEIVMNAEPLQQAWSREHDCNLSGLALLLEQLKYYKPGIVFFQDNNSVNPQFIEVIRKEVPEVQKIVGLYSSPASHSLFNNYKYYDFVFTCLPSFEKQLNKYSIRNYPFSHGFEHSLLPLIESNNQYDVTDFLFIGSFLPNSDFHDDRVQILNKLAESGIDMSIYSGNIASESFASISFKQSAYLIYKLLEKLFSLSALEKFPTVKKIGSFTSMPRKLPIPKKLKNIIQDKTYYGLEMLKVLSRSLIGFNIHGGITGDYAANVRMFEVTGVGSCLVTDHKNNINKYFKPDSEIVTYNSPQECIEKINWLLDHPVERKEIALRGQKRTLRDHCLKNRILEINEVIRNELSIS